MISVLVFILILSILVILHELGHFIMAKRAGIGVEEFGFGLPPRIWGKKIGETLYSINLLPFGGFVRLVGEDPTDEKKNAKNSYYNKPALQRALVVIAGVVVNFILAVVIFYVVIFSLGFKVSLPLLVDHDFKFVNQSKQVLVTNVAPDSPAAKTGIKPLESIISANGEKVESIEELQSIIRTNRDSQIELVLEDPANNKTRTVSVTPTFDEKVEAPIIGVGLDQLAVLRYETLPQKLFAGFGHSYNTIAYSKAVFGELIGYSLKNRDITPVSEGVSGPVGIASITSQAVKLGPLSVLQLAALLSLNLAVVNVLPIPALDGGRFFFIIIEAITRRRIYPTVEKWVHAVGFVLLIGLIILVTYNDILKLVR
ncbi:MAG: M50 family metallopeptidase [Candidatus Curtissbacteria bacterium]|nr:M50 family metallopeptidase [Candidatus Curtissbacteria bacterium]